MEEEESINWGQTFLFLQKFISEKVHTPDSSWIYATGCIIAILVVYFILKFFTSKNIKIEIYDKKEKSDNYNINLSKNKDVEHLIMEIKDLKNVVKDVIKANNKTRREIRKFSKGRVIYPDDMAPVILRKKK